MQRKWMRTGALLILTAIAFFVVSNARAQQAQPSDLSNLFDKREVMISARDGIKLHTEIYSPKNVREPLPILFGRTPYGIAAPDKGISPMIRRYRELFPEGYIFVFQDIRGRYGSEGKFEMLHPLHNDAQPNGTDESTDTYDSIEWLVKNVEHNNGRVGMDGISYDGFLRTRR
jgi:putative CocE/NonD family hydrolase